MAETREQFRSRIRDVAINATDQPHALIKQDWADASEAVYAAALRDYRSHLVNMGADYWMISGIEKFAASLGISLEDTP